MEMTQPPIHGTTFSTRLPASRSIGDDTTPASFI
jgi:hypothetical protein